MAFGDNLRNFWATKRADREARRQGFRDLQEGLGERPWWISVDEWERRGAAGAAKNAIDTWNTNASLWQASAAAGYQDSLDWMKNYLYTTGPSGTITMNTPQYTPYSSAQYDEQNAGYQKSLESLLAQITAGTTSVDDEEAFNRMAKLYGMTPEEFRAMQSEVSGSTPESIYGRAESMAMASSSMTQAFEASMRSQQRAVMADMGKQLEAIFSERGGLGGFAQAQEMTLAISDQFLQQKTQFMVDRFAQAMETVNADLDRKRQLIASGQTDAQEFLASRWAEVQMAYQDTMAASQQALQEYIARSQLHQQEYATQLQAFLAPVEAMKDMMMTQMGVDQGIMAQMQAQYDLMLGPYLDALALLI